MCSPGLVWCDRTAAMPPPSDIVKVAIEWPGANAQLLEIDQVSDCLKTFHEKHPSSVILHSYSIHLFIDVFFPVLVTLQRRFNN